MSYGQYSYPGSADGSPAKRANNDRDFTRGNAPKVKTEGKRQKHVFPTDEIAHLWAHKTQDDARNAGGNFYFSGDTIYSYGSHFPIARHVTNERGEAAVLFTNRTWGPTTAKHVNNVRGSLPPGVPVFYVERPDHATKNEYQTQRAEVEALIKKLQAARPDNRYTYKVKTSKIKFNARTGTDAANTDTTEVDAIAGRNVVAHPTLRPYSAPSNTDWTLSVRNGPNAGIRFESRLSRTEARIALDQLDSIKTWDVSTPEKRARLHKKVQKARDIAKEFGSISRNPGTLTKLWREFQSRRDAVNALGQFFGYGPHIETPIELAYLAGIEVEHEQRVVRARGVTRARRRSRWEIQNEKATQEFAEKLPRWLAGENVSLGYGGGGTAYLRVDGNEVQTSQGARVPLEHVKKALPVVLALIQNGREYHRNGHTIHLGHYAIDSIDAQGNLRAGCHLFDKAEIERFAGVLEGTPDVPPVAVVYAPHGATPVVVARCNAVKEAEDWIAEKASSDPIGVERGDYGIDAPEEMVNPIPDPQTNEALSQSGQ